MSILEKIAAVTEWYKFRITDPGYPNNTFYMRNIRMELVGRTWLTADARCPFFLDGIRGCCLPIIEEFCDKCDTTPDKLFESWGIHRTRALEAFNKCGIKKHCSGEDVKRV